MEKVVVGEDGRVLRMVKHGSEAVMGMYQRLAVDQWQTLLSVSGLRSG